MKPIAIAVCAIAALLLNDALSVIRAWSPTQHVRAYREAHEGEIIEEFVELLRIPNVASDTANIRRNAAMLIEMMERRGIKARVLEGNGPSSVFGELKTEGATRTITFYAH